MWITKFLSTLNKRNTATVMEELQLSMELSAGKYSNTSLITLL
jgi:hypothetical protein